MSDQGEQTQDWKTVRTRRWQVGITAALVSVAVGLVATNTTILLTAIISIGYIAYAEVTNTPDVSILVERELSEDSPMPTEEVEVELSIHNEGESTLPDLRFSDSLPESLEFVEGSLGGCRVLRPGESVVTSYKVEASRGSHDFGPVTVAVRNMSGSKEAKKEFSEVEGDNSLVCRTDLEEMLIQDETVQHTGKIESETGGPGVEFFATREYQPGDPLSRIDWNRLAKTRELTTVEFREQLSSTIVLVIDDRRSQRTRMDSQRRRTAGSQNRRGVGHGRPGYGNGQGVTGSGDYVASQSGDEEGVSLPSLEEGKVPDALGLCLYGADRVFTSLVDNGNSVGIYFVSGSPGWIEPGSDSDHRWQGRDFLGSARDPAGTELGVSSNSMGNVEDLVKRLPSNSQVVFFSPLFDEYVVDTAEELEAYGHTVTVFSPDATLEDTPGRKIASIERSKRIEEIERNGIPVIDWSPDEHVSLPVAKTIERWLK